MQRHILHDLLLLMHLALGDGHVFLSFQIKLRSVCVGAADTLARSGVCFDVYDVSNSDFFFLDSFVDGRVETEFLSASCRFETDD